MGLSSWRRVPLGPEAERWNTAAVERTVLLVVHNVTSAVRLLDVLPVFDDDERLQLLYTCTGSSPFLDGVDTLFGDLEVAAISWDVAVGTRFDLAVSASHGGKLSALNAPLITLPHGMGYNKYLDMPDANGRTIAHRVFGLTDEWLLDARGHPIAAATVLSHSEQLERLTTASPRAVPTAVVAGDPCFDRLLESAPDRNLYREHLGLHGDRRLVVVNTTWGRESLYRKRLRVVDRLLAELPCDEYAVAAVVHPNVPHAHGAAEVARHLADANRAGLIRVPPREGWRAVLTAADAVIGDHGSVPYYAAALGIPTMLAVFPKEAVAPDSPIGEFGVAAPRLDFDSPLRSQVESLIEKHDAEQLAHLTDKVTSVPGASLSLLRALCYRLLRLAEPSKPIHAEPVPLLKAPGRRVSPLLAVVHGDRVERFPYAVREHAPPRDGAHVVVDATYPAGRYSALADVLVRDAHGAPDDWPARMLARHPGLGVAALIDGQVCRMTARDGTVSEAVAPRGTDPSALASLAYDRLSSEP